MEKKKINELLCFALQSPRRAAERRQHSSAKFGYDKNQIMHRSAQQPACFPRIFETRQSRHIPLPLPQTKWREERNTFEVKLYKEMSGKSLMYRTCAYTPTSHFFIYTLLVKCWTPFCLQSCLNSSWRTFNKVLEKVL